MNFTSYLSKFPSSFYTKEESSNLYKLWKLLSEKVEEIETAVQDWYDKDTLTGIQLDKIGLLKGIPRNGLNDTDYKYELNLPRTLEIVTMPAIYEILSNHSTNFSVRELHTPYLYDYAKMDGSDFLDGNGVFNPEIEVAIVDFLDGIGYLDGLDILEPYHVRNLGLLVAIATSDGTEITKIQTELSRLMTGITVYYNVAMEFQTGLTENQYSTTLNGEGLLDGNGIFTPECKILLYSGATLTHEIPISYGWSVGVPQSSGAITLIEIQNGGETLFSRQTTIQTTEFIQYTITEA